MVQKIPQLPTNRSTEIQEPLLSRFEDAINWFSLLSLPVFFLVAYIGLDVVEGFFEQPSDSKLSLALQLCAALCLIGGPVAIACMARRNFAQNRTRLILVQLLLLVGWSVFLYFQIGLVPLGFLALVILVFWLWYLWMRLCFVGWIEMWASSESLRLQAQKVFLIHRGPFWSLPFTPVYRVVCLAKDRSIKTGWVRLGVSFFYGGKGVVIWDHLKKEESPS